MLVPMELFGVLIMAALLVARGSTEENSTPTWHPDEGVTLASKFHASTVLHTHAGREELNVISIAYHNATAMFANAIGNGSRPFWVDYSVHNSGLKERYASLTKELDGSQRACGLEVLGVMPKNWGTDGIAQLRVAAPSAPHHDPSTGTTDFQQVSHCIFVSNWVRREGLVPSTVRSVLFWCPVAAEHAEVGCAQMLNADVDMELQHNLQNKQPASSQFTARRLLIHSTDECEARGAVSLAPAVTIATITHTVPEHFTEMRLQLYTWVVHHLRLGLRVVVYDKGGMHADYVQETMRSRGFGSFLDAGMLEYRTFSIRGVIGYRDEIQVHARADQDKALTYTYSRFEHYARSLRCAARGVVHPVPALIIDFDEFVMCSNNPNPPLPREVATLEEQRAILRKAIATHARSKKDEMTWGRFAVPMVAGHPDCLEVKHNKTAGGNGRDMSIFECYGGFYYKNNQNTIKTMHSTMACPNTDFHFSCCKTCPCGKKYQNHCFLMHLRPIHSYKYKGTEPELAEMYARYEQPGVLPNSADVGETHRNELADIWRSAD